MCFPCRDLHFQPYEDDVLKMIIQKRLTDPQVVPEATISHAIFRVCLTLTHFGALDKHCLVYSIPTMWCLTMLTLHFHADSASHVHYCKVTVQIVYSAVTLAMFSIADEGSWQVQCEEYP